MCIHDFKDNTVSKYLNENTEIDNKHISSLMFAFLITISVDISSYLTLSWKEVR